MYLGLDLGTSSVKGSVIDETQMPVAIATAPLTVTRPQDNWVEQDPADWIAAIKSVLEKLAETVPLSRVSGIGLSGHMHGATLLGADGTVLAPCILWNDTRAHVQAAAMDADPAWRRISGNVVFPGFTAPKLQWLREEQPALFAKVATVLLPKDYVRFWLTGELVGEMSDAAGTSWLDTGKRDWDTELLEKTGLTRAQMPRLVEGSDVSGVLRSEIAQEFGFAADVPVAGGAGDNAASAIGMGVVARGQSFVSLGTSGVLFAASDAYKPDPATAVHTFCHVLPEMWHQMGVILSASDSMTWWGKMLGQSPSALTRGLGALQAPGRTLFLPFLGGERTPWNSASLRGAFVGLEQATDQAAGTRAIMEGVSFALADSKAALAACGTEMTTCLAVGGGSASDYWLAALATALDMPLDVPEGSETGAAFGAARLGMMAATGTTDISTPPKINRTIDPDAALRDAFAAAHARYIEATQHIMDLT